MTAQGFPLLSLIILLPLIGALAVAWQKRPETTQWLALACAGLELPLTLAALWGVDAASPAVQWQERHAWIPSLHVDYFLGVDGIAAPFLPLTALLGVAAFLAFLAILGGLFPQPLLNLSAAAATQWVRHAVIIEDVAPLRAAP